MLHALTKEVFNSRDYGHVKSKEGDIRKKVLDRNLIE